MTEESAPQAEVPEESAVVIQAAGAVLWRRDADESLKVALIHRPRYDDWSLPKGKVNEGETDVAGAYREVLEETGIEGIFGPELHETIYEVDGVPKIVRYWAAQASDAPLGTIDPEEVDQIEWLEPAVAREKLTLEKDRSVIDSFLHFGPETTPLILLRHARAVQRSAWDGDDGDRPLDNHGQVQAKRMLQNILPYRVDEIHSSDAVRCLQTVEPFARAISLQIIISSDLSEYRHATDSESSLEYVQDIMDSGESALVCSHNPVLPTIVKKLIGKKTFKKLDRKLEPGEAWVLHHRDGEVIAIDWMASPIV